MQLHKQVEGQIREDLDTEDHNEQSKTKRNSLSTWIVLLNIWHKDVRGNGRDPQIVTEVDKHAAGRVELEELFIYHKVAFVLHIVLYNVGHEPGAVGEQGYLRIIAVDWVEEHEASVGVDARDANTIE